MSLLESELVRDDEAASPSTFTAMQHGVFIDTSKFTNSGSTYGALVHPMCQDITNLRNQLRGCPVGFNALEGDPHTTVMYSRYQQVDFNAIMACLKDSIGQDMPQAIVKKVEYWDAHDNSGVLVLKLVSDNADELNKAFIAAGAKHSFDDYTPHMTLAYEVGPQTDALARWIKAMNMKLADEKPLPITFSGIKISDCKQDI